MTLPKIDEWIKEVESRPASAQTILKLIAGRLRDLTTRNEELLAENIALQDGTRAEQYRKRIAHLEYQLDLLKRRFGLDQSQLEALAAGPAAVLPALLVYNAHGRILRLEPGSEAGMLGRLSGEMSVEGEAPRLLAVPGNEELLLLFSSGRISTCAVEDLPTGAAGQEWALEQAALPEEPHASERLVCVLPLSGLPLADFFLQASRRGCVKKTMSSMAETVLENHYLGRGAIQRMDQPLDLSLCHKKELYTLVTHTGRLLGLNVDELSYSVEERFKLEPTDHVMAGFVIRPEELLLCLTQTGKVISRSASFIEPVKSAAARGQALIPPARLEQGVRFIGAAAVRETDRVALLDAAGELSLHAQAELTGAGVVRQRGRPAGFCHSAGGGCQRAKPMSLKVGLDFGTSNSGVAVYDGQQVKVLPLDRQNGLPEVVKTVLYITRDYQCAIGQEAIRQYYLHNVNRQRRYVRQWAGEIDVVGADMHFVRDVYVYVDELKPGRLMQYLKTALRKSTPGGYAGTQVFERWYTVGSLVEIYLAQLKRRAEELLGEPIQGVTLGRPVKFAETPEQDARAEATLRQAAYAAGFKQVDFELEPVAAALDYQQSIAGPQNVVIFDFGGGTLDIAVMRLGERSGPSVYASGGVDIAGSDFDRAIIQKRMLVHFGQGQISHQPEILELIEAIPDWMALPELATPQNRNVLEKAIRAGLAPVRMKALQALIYNDLAFTFYNRVEAAKIALSEQGASVVSLEDRGIPLWELYTRSQFEADILEYTGRVEQTLLETLAAAGLEPGNIEAVVKTGGSSSIPLFNEMLVRIFGAEKVKSSNAFSSVVAGLAIRAGRE